MAKKQRKVKGLLAFTLWQFLNRIVWSKILMSEKFDIDSMHVGPPFVLTKIETYWNI